MTFTLWFFVLVCHRLKIPDIVLTDEYKLQYEFHKRIR